MNQQLGGQTALLKSVMDQWVARLLAGVLFLVALSGCSVTSAQARATYQAEIIKVTATAQVDQKILANTTPVSENAIATVTQVVAQNNYVRKQSEDQMFTGIGIGWFVIVAVVIIALAAGFYYGGNLKLRTDLEVRRHNLPRPPNQRR